jgi:hypothetical protein
MIAAVNVAALIVDYVLICEKRSELLDFGEFVALWVEANAIAEMSVETA